MPENTKPKSTSGELSLATVLTLPRRRGVVMRHDGISDSYGKRYVRMDDGSLRRETQHHAS